MQLIGLHAAKGLTPATEEVYALYASLVHDVKFMMQGGRQRDNAFSVGSQAKPARKRSFLSDTIQFMPQASAHPHMLYMQFV